MPSQEQGEDSAELSGTTLRVYRYMLKQHHPIGISAVQKGLGLSSPSVAQYHIRKLLQMGLIREEESGYIVDKIVLDNVIRIRRMSIPLQSAYLAFFTVTLIIFVVVLRPGVISSVYFLAIVVNIVALAISFHEVVKTLKKL